MNGYAYLLCTALNEAAERFRELQAEKEMRQLQEDRKNDKKPPPYKHIKVGPKVSVNFVHRQENFMTSAVIGCLSKGWVNIR